MKRLALILTVLALPFVLCGQERLRDQMLHIYELYGMNFVYDEAIDIDSPSYADISKGRSLVYIRMNFSETASAMLLNVSVVLNDTPDRMVTPVKASLRLKDSTVTEISSPRIDGTKHSILDIAF